MNFTAIKPHLVFQPDRCRWYCHDNHYTQGFGTTPYSAYVDWHIKCLRITRLPRHGWWNLKDCKSWFNRGCRPIRSYIGVQQIVGYDPITDELLMRG